LRYNVPGLQFLQPGLQFESWQKEFYSAEPQSLLRLID